MAKTTRALLIATALGEGGAGLMLAIWPSALVWILLGTSIDIPTGLIIGRVAGVALLAFAIACWMGRDDGSSAAATGLIAGMLVYSTAVVALLAHAGTVYGLVGVGLWPAVLVHVALSAWCFGCLRAKRLNLGS